MIPELFRKTIENYGITGKALSERTGISQSAISEIRRGKSDPSSSVLWRLLIAMDEIAPGSRRYFCDLLAGSGSPFFLEPQELVDSMDSQELSAVVLAIADKLKRVRLVRESTDVESDANAVSLRAG